ILLDDKRAYEVERDERVKLLALPLWQIDALASAHSPATLLSRSGDEGRNSGHLAFVSGERSRSEGVVGSDDRLFADQLPDIILLRRTQGQLEQQISLLRHVEALRLYAAEQEGKIPGRLEDMTVPLPADPVTGKPFAYTLEGTTACICGSPLRNNDSRTKDKLRYNVTVQK
ncbi:MAG TPA: hypothetical protein VKE94_14135, partial [Gemmataceae bacterium]|nr:hypothetical protein [Gemmataceae bacterium]